MFFDFQLLATPWWVNLLIFVPVACFFVWRKKGLFLSSKNLVVAALFGIAFGLIEAAVVIYLRAALNMLPSALFSMRLVFKSFPITLVPIEAFREAATIIVLLAVGYLAGQKSWDRVAAFLWSFAFWDIFYYLFLYLFIGWPPNLTTGDILFILPLPWFGQVWFPLLVSSLTIAAVLAGKSRIAGRKL